MRKTAPVLLGGLAILAVLAAIIPKPEGSRFGVGMEVSYWMNVAEPGGMPKLTPLNATIHAVREDGTVDLLVSFGGGQSVRVDKAERATRAKAGYWTKRP